MAAYNPSSIYYYLIEVKYGPSAGLGGFQRLTKARVQVAREEKFYVSFEDDRELIPKYVVC